MRAEEAVTVDADVNAIARQPPVQAATNAVIFCNSAVLSSRLTASCLSSFAELSMSNLIAW